MDNGTNGGKDADKKRVSLKKKIIILRITGIAVFAVCGALAAAGTADFFISISAAKPPKLFWMMFAGIPLCAVGFTLALVSFQYSPKKKSARRATVGVGRLCPVCGTENSGDAKYCKECGKEFLPKCPYCGAEISPDSKFCDKCGKSVGAGGAAHGKNI
jgi:predicted nucleic acid-binding Zn ribbon protein